MPVYSMTSILIVSRKKKRHMTYRNISFTLALCVAVMSDFSYVRYKPIVIWSIVQIWSRTRPT